MARPDEYDELLTGQPIFRERHRGRRRALGRGGAGPVGLPGPILRSTGVAWDLRRTMPYLEYDEVDFDVIVGTYGDNFDRYAIRLNEIRESIRIVRQVLEQMPAGDYRVQDKKVTPPPRARIDESMEALIHHFKIFTEGFKVPEGEVYVAIESPRGELGCYLVSDGSPKPYRMHIRGPSFVNLQGLPVMMRGGLVADAVAIVLLGRPGHGRGGPVSEPPPPRSALRDGPAAAGPGTEPPLGRDHRPRPRAHRPLPRAPLGPHPALPPGPGAGRLAAPRGHGRHRRPGRGHPGRGPRHGHLLRHAPHRAGRHATWWRCAPTSPACSAAPPSCSSTPRTSLGVNAGGTTADGMFTLEEAECLADCDRAPCVQVNHRFFGALTAESFDRLVDRPPVGCPVRRHPAPRHPDPGAADHRARVPTPTRVAAERAAMAEAQAERAASRRGGQGQGHRRRGEARRDGRHRRPQDRHLAGSATTTPTPSSATWPPAATRGCARR